MNTWFRTLAHLLVLCILAIEVAPSQPRVPRKEQTHYSERALTQPSSIHQPMVKNDSTPSFYKRKAEWKKIIDAYWGPGDTYSTKLSVFDTYVNFARVNFPGFVYSKLNWDSVAAFWRAKINDSTSRGAFHVILGMLGYSLNEFHAGAFDDVVEATPMTPGTPWTSGLGIQENYDVRHFGAALTPLPDKSLLVYKVVANHPLGLERGDRVLGYEGVLWPKLFDELSAAGVGTDFLVGGCPTAKEHYRLAFAGMFWHLFDTIDVVKYGTGQTVHLPTAPLTNLNLTGPLLNCDQLPVPGVPMPSEDLLAGDVTYGVVQGTNIGYVYVRHHMHIEISSQFLAAVRALANTEGLVIDMRLDYGGRYGLEQGIAQLVNFGDSTLQFRRRYSPDDLQTMVPANLIDVTIPLEAGTIYDHPVAVLLGPQCRSWGDLTAHQLSYIPGVRFFGKSSHGTYAGHWWCPYPLSVSGYSLYCPDFIEVDHRFPDVQLLNTEFPIDEDVWLTPDGAARGEDDVVKRAIEWIATLTYAHDAAVSKTNVTPVLDTVCVTARLTNPLNHSAAVSSLVIDGTGVTRDSIGMYNDGLNGDGQADDSVWGCYVPSPATEDIYTVTVRADDITLGTFRKLPNAIGFTTAGPLTIDSLGCTFLLSRYIQIKPYIRNNGSTYTIRGAKLVFTSRDPWVQTPATASLTLADIPPGGVSTSTTGVPTTVRYDSVTCPGYVNLVAEMSVGGRTYWTDTTRVYLPGVGVEDEETLPTTFALEQNYPNPFNPTTGIRYQVSGASDVKLVVYDMLGREVAVLVSEKKAPGRYEVRFDATGLASGVYFYRLTAGDFVATKRLVFVR